MRALARGHEISRQVAFLDRLAGPSVRANGHETYPTRQRVRSTGPFDCRASAILKLLCRLSCWKSCFTGLFHGIPWRGLAEDCFNALSEQFSDSPSEFSIQFHSNSILDLVHGQLGLLRSMAFLIDSASGRTVVTSPPIDSTTRLKAAVSLIECPSRQYRPEHFRSSKCSSPRQPFDPCRWHGQRGRRADAHREPQQGQELK